MRSSCIILLLLFSIEAAQAFPVEDVTEWAKTMTVFNQLKTQYQTLQNQYNQLVTQNQQLKTQYQSITGNYGWGRFQNNLAALKHQREWAPANWQSALKGLSGGNPARYQQLLTQYKASHQVLTAKQYANGKTVANSYQQQVSTNQASATTASYTFNAINQHLKDLYQLSQQIENKGQNQDLKSAVDLNSRIEVEIGYIAIEELRMQTLVNQQLASRQANQIALESQTAQFNQAGA